MGSFSNKFLFLQNMEVTHVPCCSNMDVCESSLHSNNLKSTHITLLPSRAARSFAPSPVSDPPSPISVSHLPWTGGSTL